MTLKEMFAHDLGHGIVDGSQKRDTRKRAQLMLKSVGESEHFIAQSRRGVIATRKLKNGITNLSDDIVETFHGRRDSFSHGASG